MSRYDRVERTVPWIIVTVFLAGAVLVAAGIIADGLALALAGTFMVVAAGLAGVILPQVGLSAPLSFNANFPEEGRASASQAPAGDDPQQDQRYHTMPEVPARRLPDGPDPERAKPQHVNLGPHERLRVLSGEEVIEVPEDERES